MGETHVFQCDGPTCLETDEDSWDHPGLRDAGWQVFEFLQPDEDDEDNDLTHVAFFCSFKCMADWALELVE